MAISTETLLLGSVVLSVSVLLIAIMISVGDQYSRFGSAMRGALAAGMLALVVVYNVPMLLQRSGGIAPAGTAALWGGRRCRGPAVMTIGAVVQFGSMAVLGRRGSRRLPHPEGPKRASDAKDGAER